MDTVTPRFGDIAAKVAGNGYAIVPLEWRQKRPCADVEDWPRYRYEPGHEKRWPQAGLGLLCGRIAAIDIDVCDEGSPIRSWCWCRSGLARRRGVPASTRSAR